MSDYTISKERENEIKSNQLEKDALEIINMKLNKRYRSLKEINLMEILNVPSKHNE